jgi:DNA-binding transcriptional LysR family regulator
MDKLAAIKVFVEVAKFQSFTLAAEQLGISRLQASRQIQVLEDWLSQRLFHRTTRQVSLTPAGQEALKHFEQILLHVDKLELQAQELSNELSGTIRISTPIGFANNALLKIVAAFTELHPRVTIDVLANDNFSDLVEDQVDIALRFTAQPDDTLIARRLLHLHSMVCASPDYLQRCGQPAHPQHLTQHNCFVHLDMANWSFHEHQDSFVVKVSGTIKANSMEVLINAAVDGHGIVYAPSDLATPLIKSGKLVNIFEDYTHRPFALWAVYLSRSYQSPRVRSFIDFLAAKLGN